MIENYNKEELCILQFLSFVVATVFHTKRIRRFLSLFDNVNVCLQKDYLGKFFKLFNVSYWLISACSNTSYATFFLGI